LVIQPTSTMKTTISGSVTAMVAAERKSVVAIATPTTIGTVVASTSCGRYRAK
jgi:hypothetical protein